MDAEKDGEKTENFYSRTALLTGEGGLQKLKASTVALFGLGGVGGFTAEALARAGVGKLVLVDNDCVSLSNVNRQLVALRSTVGRAKTDVMKERIADINPDAGVETYRLFFTAENASLIDFSSFDYIADAIDTVSSKILLAQIAGELDIPVISAMGAGNKMRPELFEIADIYETSVCPLARVMRRELKNRGVRSLKCVYSREKPLPPVKNAPKKGKAPVPGSISFVPAAAGLILAGEIIRDLLLS